MARDYSPVLKKCRTLGISPSVLGYNKKPSIRHQQTQGRNKKMSEYGLQLREKQKAKFVYGILERQFRGIYERAAKMNGSTGENLLRLLEQRLDNIVFRAKFARTRSEARQIIRHGHITINGKKVDIPSYTIRSGDIVELSSKAKNTDNIKTVLAATEGMFSPEWLKVDRSNYKIEIVSLPQRTDIDFDVDERFIVELYSR